MKIVSVIVLLILVSNCGLASFAPTSEDLAWMKGAVYDMKMVGSDATILSTTLSAGDLVSSIKYCRVLSEDAEIGIQNSQKYAVSNELDDAKSYYELALMNAKEGAEKVAKGCELQDASLLNQGTQLISKATEYIGLVGREFNRLSPK